MNFFLKQSKNFLFNIIISAIGCNVLVINSYSHVDINQKISIKKVNDKTASLQHQELALNKLILLLKKNNSFTANIEQKSYSQNNGVLTSKGLVKIHQPNKFYYEISSPDNTLYIYDGNILWQYNRDLMQVVKKKLSKNSTDLPLLVLTNPDKKVLKYFEVKEISHNVFILTIKSSDSFIKQLLISFDNKNTLNQFQILNTSDQRTQIDFSNLKHVESFKKSVFEFDIPKGVDVLS